MASVPVLVVFRQRLPQNSTPSSICELPPHLFSSVLAHLVHHLKSYNILMRYNNLASELTAHTKAYVQRARHRHGRRDRHILPQGKALRNKEALANLPNEDPPNEDLRNEDPRKEDLLLNTSI